MSTLPPTIQHTALSSVLDMGTTPSEAVCLYALLCYCLSPPLLIEAPLYRAAENNNKQIRRVIWGDDVSVGFLYLNAFEPGLLFQWRRVGWKG